MTPDGRAGYAGPLRRSERAPPGVDLAHRAKRRPRPDAARRGRASWQGGRRTRSRAHTRRTRNCALRTGPIRSVAIRHLIRKRRVTKEGVERDHDLRADLAQARLERSRRIPSVPIAGLAAYTRPHVAFSCLLQDPQTNELDTRLQRYRVAGRPLWYLAILEASKMPRCRATLTIEANFCYCKKCGHSVNLG